MIVFLDYFHVSVPDLMRMYTYNVDSSTTDRCFRGCFENARNSLPGIQITLSLAMM